MTEEGGGGRGWRGWAVERLLGGFFSLMGAHGL